MGFSRSQANGFIIFLPLVVLSVLSEPIYRAWVIGSPRDYTADIKTLDSLVALWPAVPRDSARVTHTSRPRRPLDPNIASMTELIQIGLPETLAGRIISYRKKGGRFKTSADLKKIYGMDSSLLANIAPALTFSSYAENRIPPVKPMVWSLTKRQPLLQFDLNTADTTQLKSIRGIGSKLSLRIIKYREALGGFRSLNQLSEIYRLDTAGIRLLKKASFIAPDFEPVKMNINTSAEQDLARHPYLQKNEASAVVAYRFKHGKFNSLSELADIKILDTAAIRKIIPYLECR